MVNVGSHYKFTFRIDVEERRKVGENLWPSACTCGERKIEINEAFSRSVGSTIRIEGVAIPITRGWNAYRSIDRSTNTTCSSVLGSGGWGHHPRSGYLVCTTGQKVPIYSTRLTNTASLVAPSTLLIAITRW